MQAVLFVVSPELLGKTITASGPSLWLLAFEALVGPHDQAAYAFAGSSLALAGTPGAPVRILVCTE